MHFLQNPHQVVKLVIGVLMLITTIIALIGNAYGLIAAHGGTVALLVISECVPKGLWRIIIYVACLVMLSLVVFGLRSGSDLVNLQGMGGIFFGWVFDFMEGAVEWLSWIGAVLCILLIIISIIFDGVRFEGKRGEISAPVSSVDVSNVDVGTIDAYAPCEEDNVALFLKM